MSHLFRGVRKLIAGVLALMMLIQPSLTFGESSLTFAQNSQFLGSTNISGHTNLADQYVSESGAFAYTINVDAPVGVGGMKPDFGISYSSQNKDNHTVYGYGWSENVPYIERDNLTGLNNIYEEFNFVSSQHGKLTSTSTIGYGSYTPRESSVVVRYEYLSGDVWKMYAIDGTIYTYGSDTDSRLDDPNNINRVHRWYLEKVEDTNGNYISYSYDKQSNQIYLDNINYSGYGVSDGIYDIEFNYSTSTTFSNYFPGFKVVTDRVIDSVEVKHQNSLIKQYDFDYVISPDSGRSLLDSVQQHSWNNGQQYTLPKTEFTYTESDLFFTLENNFTQIPLEANTGDEIFENFRTSIPVTYADSDFDGVQEIHAAYWKWDGDEARFRNWWNPELEQWMGGYGESYSNYISEAILRDGTHRLMDQNGDQEIDFLKVRKSNGDSQRIYDIDGNYFYANGSRTKFGDVNGDGLTDVILGDDDNDGDVWFNIPGSSWQRATMPHGWNNLADNIEDGGNALYIDINNDGLTDKVMRGCNSGCKMHLWINTGDNGQWDTTKWSDLPAGPMTSEDSADAYVFNDINGDGLLDVLISSNTQTSVYTQNISGSFILQTLNLTFPNFAKKDDDEFLSQAVWFYDMDGDGLDDVFVPREGDTKVYWNNSQSVDRLISVDTSSDTSIVPNYERTTELYHSDGTLKNPSLNTPLDVVTSISIEDGLGNMQETEYDYYDGVFTFESHDKKRLGGFGRIEKTDTQTGLQTTAYYHQGNSNDSNSNEEGDQYEKIGRSYHVVVSDSNTTDLVSETFNIWNTITLNNGSNLTVLEQSVQRDYEIGTTDYKESAISNTYSIDHGQTLSRIEWGEVVYDESSQELSDIGDDKRITEYQYAIGFNQAVSVFEEIQYLDRDVSYRAHNQGGRQSPVTDIYGLAMHVSTSTSQSFDIGIDEFHQEGYIRRARIDFDMSTISNPANYDLTDIDLVLRIQDSDDFDHALEVFDGECGHTVTLDNSLTCNTSTTTLSIPYNPPFSNNQQTIPISFLNPAVDMVENKISNDESLLLIVRSTQENSLPAYVSTNSYVQIYDNSGTQSKPNLKLIFAVTEQTDIPFYTVSQVTIKENTTNIVSDTKYFYDNLSHGQITDGNQTKVSQWLDIDNSWIDTDYTYNSVGLPLTVTDAQGNTTTNTYNTYNVFPQTITNELNHATTNEYDYSIGKINKITDPNGVVTENIYDGFGRIIEKKQSAPSGDVTTMETHVYEDVSMPRSVTSAIYHTAVPQYQYSYTDGLGRTLQTKTLTSNSNYNTVTYTYNNAGQLESQTLPYVSSTASYDATIPSGVNQTIYTYDVASRVVDTTSPMGTSSVVHSTWEKTITNQRGFDKTNTYDAFGNLIQVNEQIDTLTASSTGSTGNQNISPYDYKQSLTITGQSGAGTDYQVLLKIGKDSSIGGADFHLEGNAQFFPQTRNDGGDLAFYDNNETTMLPFWVEKVENDVAHVWVKVTDDLDTNQNIYIYYGNATPVNYSDGEGTFIFFDEFEGGVLDATKWHTEDVNITISNDIASVNNSTSGYGALLSKQHFGPNTAIRFKGRIAQTWVGTHYMGYNCQVNSGSEDCSTTNWARANFSSRWQNDPVAETRTGDDSGSSEWGTFSPNFVNTHQLFEIRRPDANNQKYYLNDNLELSRARSFAADTSFRVWQYYSGKNGNNEIDWIAVRKNIMIDPSYNSSNGEELVYGTHAKYTRLVNVDTVGIDLGDPADLEESLEGLTTVEFVIEEEPTVEILEKESVEEIVGLTQIEEDPVTTEIEEIAIETENTSEEEFETIVEPIVNEVMTETVETVEQVIDELVIQEVTVELEETATGPVLEIVENITEPVRDVETMVDVLTDTEETVETDPAKEAVIPEIELSKPTKEEVPIAIASSTSPSITLFVGSSTDEFIEEEIIGFSVDSIIKRDKPAKSYRYRELVWHLEGKINKKEQHALVLENKILIKKQTLANLHAAKQKKVSRIDNLKKTIEKRETKGKDTSSQKSNLTKNKERLDKIQNKIDKIKVKRDDLKDKLKKTKVKTKQIKERVNKVNKKNGVSIDQTQAQSGWLKQVVGLFSTPLAYASSWANSLYGYKQQITITGQSGAGTDYQVLLKIGKDSSIGGADFHLEGNAQFFPQTRNDGGDLAFYDNNETTMLPFWVEKVENDVAHVWVKVTDDLDTNQNIYIYYGNATPNNYSDGDETFIIFDDFDTGVLDSGKFTMAKGNHSGITNSEIKLDFRDVIRTNVKFSDDVKVGSSHRITSTSNYAIAHFGLASNWDNFTWPQTEVLVAQTRSSHYNPDLYLYGKNNGSSITAGTTNLDMGTAYHNWYLHAGEDTQKIYYDGTMVISANESYTNNDVYAYWSFSDVGDGYFDWVFVAKQVDIEPLFNFSGGEEQYSVSESENNGGGNATTTSGTAITRYFYDTQNQLVEIIDAEGNKREFTYDSLGRQTSSELPHNSASTSAMFAYEYDTVGRKTKETRPDGSVINYTYDDLNRVLTVDNPAEGVGAEVIYSYDSATNGIGKIAGVSGDGYTKTYQYDQAGNVVAETINVGGTVHITNMSYSEYGLLESTISPDGSVVSNSYYLTGDVSGVDRDSSDVVDIDYNHTGQIVSQDYANGIDTTYTYDDDLEYRLENKVTQNGTSTLEDITYQYDSVGNITEIDNTGVISPYTKQYSYDSIDRLQVATTSDTLGTSTDTYTYSETGNILTHNNDAYGYTNGTFPQVATDFAGNTYTYDANGNLSSKNDGSVTSTYTYDWNDRLSSVDQGTTNLGTYTYTDARQRLSKTVGTSTKYYVNTAVEFDGTDYQNFVFAGTNRVASIDTGGITYNHTDHLQSSSLQTDSTGGVTSASTYKPFGSTDSQTGTGAHDYTYTDQEFDSVTALHYMDARYYDAELKRFTSVDAWSGDLTSPQTLNKYSYVVNNPLIYNDPSGNRLRAVGRDVQGMGGLGTHWFVRIDDNPQINNGRKTTLGGYTHDFIGGRLFREENYSTDYSLTEEQYTSSYDITAPVPYTQEGYEQMVYDKYMNSPKYEGDYHPDGGDIQYMESNSGNVFTQSMVDAGFSLDFINDTFNTPWSYDAGVGTLPNGADRQSNVSTQDGPTLDKEEKPY